MNEVVQCGDRGQGVYSRLVVSIVLEGDVGDSGVGAATGHNKQIPFSATKFHNSRDII
jgi:hypothetical protein